MIGIGVFGARVVRKGVGRGREEGGLNLFYVSFSPLFAYSENRAASYSTVLITLQ